MSFRNIRLLFRRELVDQFRDRRTMLMIFVVPILLYPLLGISFFQFSQFVRETPSRVRVLGSEQVAAQIPESKQIQWENVAPDDIPNDMETYARTVLERKETDAVLLLLDNVTQSEEPLTLFFSSAYEKSLLAKNRVEQLVARWNKTLGEENLKERGIDIRLITPIQSDITDVAAKSSYQGASFWSKLLPVMLLLWALTGAFYPAVDLCAGEKERGTLETLLCSPATRTEIVLSKLLTVMCFSILSAVLNIVCLVASAAFMLQHIPGQKLTAVPYSGVLAMLVPLFPASLIFSALSIALASHARSSKEGQYYLLPLIMITMPLIFVSVASGSELTLGTALIPLTGIALILQQMLEGNFDALVRYSPVVLFVTILCCFFSIRIAVRQFNHESVLFSGSQKLDPIRDLRRLFARSSEVPSFTLAILFGLIVLTLKYFSNFWFSAPETFWDVFLSTLVLQVFVILVPAIVFALVFTRSAAKTLGFVSVEGNTKIIFFNTGIAMLLALVLWPTSQGLSAFVQKLYPVSEEMSGPLLELQNMLLTGPAWAVLFLLAVVPAICEELAFRGFIFNGLMPKRSEDPAVDREGVFEAVVLSAFFFGLTHGFLQQSLSATILGMLLAVIAIRTKNIFPCIGFHFVHNGLSVALLYASQHAGFAQWYENHASVLRHPVTIIVSIICGTLLFFRLRCVAPRK